MATVRVLLDAFPLGMATMDAELAVCFAGVRLREGALDDADAYVAVAERTRARAAGVLCRPAGERQARVGSPAR